MSHFRVPGTSYSPKPTFGLGRAEPLCHVAVGSARVRVKRLTLEFRRVERGCRRDEDPKERRPAKPTATLARNGRVSEGHSPGSRAPAGRRIRTKYEGGVLRITIPPDEQDQLSRLEVRALPVPQSGQMDDY
jgi:hypothetical protein